MSLYIYIHILEDNVNFAHVLENHVSSLPLKPTTAELIYDR